MMHWSGPLLTDSGGFQIFSLGHGATANEIKNRRGLRGNRSLVRLDENGALFRSHVDGTYLTLTAEKSIQIQRMLRSDIVLPLDECTPDSANRRYVEMSTARSHRWELRSLKEFLSHDNGTQTIYGIIQGAIYEDLRRDSCAFVSGEPFWGQAIGGSLGVDRKQMHEIIAMVGQMKHPQRPTHLLGIGVIEDILYGVQWGIDTFDCVHPTRLARHGGALVTKNLGDGKFHLNLKNSRFSGDAMPIDEHCHCPTCRTASRGYIHHLLKSNESLGGQLLTMHNIYFMSHFMGRIRESIRLGNFRQLQRQYFD
jgi:queuine tRNA-ribosyltransferase